MEGPKSEEHGGSVKHTCFSPLESREVHERRGRCQPFGDAASNDFIDASPVVPTDPPQAEGDFCLYNSHPMTILAQPSKTRVFFAQDLTKVYRVGEVEVHALRGINLELFAGEFVVMLGPSGSGKSTLLNILGGLDVPTAGIVHYADHDLTAADDVGLTRFRREHVGFVFQFYNLIPSLTALENVSLITEISKNPMAPEDALRLVGLQDRKDHFPSQLSGGEQQRVAIARAIAKRPDVLLCDEPTGALDVATGTTVLETLLRVNQECGTLTAIITHNATIADMADRVLIMRDGMLVQEHQNASKKQPSELNW